MAVAGYPLINNEMGRCEMSGRWIERFSMLPPSTSSQERRRYRPPPASCRSSFWSARSAIGMCPPVKGISPVGCGSCVLSHLFLLLKIVALGTLNEGITLTEVIGSHHSFQQGTKSFPVTKQKRARTVIPCVSIMARSVFPCRNWG